MEQLSADKNLDGNCELMEGPGTLQGHHEDTLTNFHWAFVVQNKRKSTFQKFQKSQCLPVIDLYLIEDYFKDNLQTSYVYVYAMEWSMRSF